MHILFLTDNFPPEGNAPATRTYEHTREWVKQGHQVTIITCAPNFPDGKVFNGYKNKWISKEVLDGINVWRVKTYITANEGFFKRTLDFLSFMISSFFFGLFTKKVDVVIGTSPQFFTVISAWALAKLKRAPFVFELRDIWPASITAVGAMQKSRVISVLEKVEMFLYRQADSIVSVTHSFKKELIHRGVDKRKIEVVLNGVDLTTYKPVTHKDTRLAKAYGLKDKFVIGYIGTHGLAHALDKVVEAAELLIDNDEIKFVFAGGGADKPRIERLVQEKGLKNIALISRQPKEKMPQLWSLCDISLVHLKNTPLFKTVIPSKIFESMGMGLPLIISAPEGEATKLVESKEAGVVIPPESPKRLVEAIQFLKQNRKVLKAYSDSSTENATYYSREKQAADMLSVLEKLLDNNQVA
ncbi:glycosyltransferase family 4 protein [Kangiella japonica]|uniref:Glycosyltransferase family 4 protein n=1 Tax=Kangiella japonica TaxID=647384 RepID=A0ABP3CD62_9GAMM